MIYIISKSTFGDYNVRDIQCNANWCSCPYSEYALIPDDLVDGILATQGYCDITLSDDGTEVASFTAREIPSVPEECHGVNTVLSVNGVNADTEGAVTLTPSDIDAAAASHNHAASNITSGTLGVARGGTGKATHTANAVLTGNGTSAVNNVATASGALYATAANGAPKFGVLPVAQGGTGSSNGATGLKNLFAAGNTVLSSYQYGSTLPTSGFTAGRIFFKKVSS